MAGDPGAVEDEDLDALDAELCAILDVDGSDGSDGSDDGGGGGGGDDGHDDDGNGDDGNGDDGKGDSAGAAAHEAPESPEAAHPPAARPPPRESLVDVLAASRTGTSAGVAALLAEVAALAAGGAPAAAAGERSSIRDAMGKHKRNDPESLRERAEKRARLATGGFTAGGVVARRKGDSDTLHSFLDAVYAKMDLRSVPLAQARHNARFEAATVLDVSELPDDPMAAKAGRFGEFWVFGCLVRKHGKRRSKDGRKFSVWTVSNMQTGSAEEAASTRKVGAAKRRLRFTTIRCLLFDGAHEAHHMAVEGAVFAMRKPSILPPQASRKEMCGDSKQAGPGRRTDDWSGVCLKVSRKDDIIAVGVCKDYGLCGKEERERGECGAWYNKKLGTMCPRHSALMLRKLETSTRMDVGNQERPGLTREDTAGARGPLNVTTSGDSGFDHQPNPSAHQNVKRVSPSEQERGKIKLLRRAAAGHQKPATPKRAVSDARQNLKAVSEREAKTAARRGNPSGVPEVHCRLRLPRRGPAGVQRARQEEYCTAVASLLSVGFSLGADGAVLPPTAPALLRLGIVLQKRPAAPPSESVRRRPTGSNGRAGHRPPPRPATNREATISAGVASARTDAKPGNDPQPKRTLDVMLDDPLPAEGRCDAGDEAGASNPASPGGGQNKRIGGGDVTRAAPADGSEEMVLSDESGSEEEPSVLSPLRKP
jgi:hypothetical protein